MWLSSEFKLNLILINLSKYERPRIQGDRDADNYRPVKLSSRLRFARPIKLGVSSSGAVNL